MSAVSDFGDRMKVYTDSMDASIDGIVGDVKNLNDQIAALQASQGQITPADQALLDGIEATAKGLSEKVSAADALTPPVAPPAP